MKFITKIGVTFATVAMMVSTATYAGTVPTNALFDNYVGADGGYQSTQDVYGGSNYDIEWMTVDKSDSGLLTVNIKSAFISHNTSSYYNLGDLFLMDADNYTQADACSDGSGRVGCNESSHQATYYTKKSTNEWEYAFDLGGNRGSNRVEQSGNLRDIANTGNTAYSSDIIETGKNGGHRGWQVIMSENDPNAVGDGGHWTTNTSTDILTMIFDISTTPLMQASQIALRWQMTCANDIIEVVTNFKGSKPGDSASVPEPGTFMLMLLAGLGFFASRQKKAMKFKA